MMALLMYLLLIAAQPTQAQEHSAQEAVPAADLPLDNDDLQISTIKNGNEKEEEPEPGPDLRLTTWNARHFGREGFDYDRAAIMVGDSDLLVLQDLRFAAGGTDPLQILVDVMKKRYGQNYCRAWLKLPSGFRHGFLWREESIGYVTSQGELKDRCLSGVIRFEAKKNLAAVDFFAVRKKRIFTLISHYVEKKPKNMEREVFSVFKTIETSSWPSFVAGNFQVNSGDSSLKKLKDFKFTTVKRAKENMWFKEATLLFLTGDFKKGPELERAVGDQYPISGAFSFVNVPVGEESMSVKTMKSAKRQSSGLKKRNVAGDSLAPNVETFTQVPAVPEDLGEDLNEQLDQIEKSIDK